VPLQDREHPQGRVAQGHDDAGENQVSRELPIITSDTYINEQQDKLGVTTPDLKEL